MTAIFALVAGCCLLNGALAASCMNMGSCPDPPVQPDFNINRYMGKWFEYVSFPTDFEEGSRCVTANYTLNADGSVVVLNGGIKEMSYGFGICPWYESSVAKGEAQIMDDKVPGKLGVRFSPYAPWGNYWVLATDYETYSVVYGCTKYMDLIPVYNEVAWVLTRERGVVPANLMDIYLRLERQGIDPGNFRLMDHKGCPVWPKED